jgi:hypothetical protein
LALSERRVALRAAYAKGTAFDDRGGVFFP